MQKKASGEDPTLIYKIERTISTEFYNTHVKLFESPMDFTILCEATFENSSWNGRQSIFGLGDTTLFRVGQGWVGGAGQKTVAFINQHGVSLFASSESLTRRIALVYDCTTFDLNTFAKNIGGSVLKKTVNATANFTDDRPILFNCGGTRTNIPISIFNVYSRKLTQNEIDTFMNGLE